MAENNTSDLGSTPKGLRLTIGLFGRRNAGKSSLLNAIANQPVSIVSAHAGTTTDPVEKAMELPPLGPVLFIDTAGLDDTGEVGELRNRRTAEVFGRCDLALVLAEAKSWGAFEDGVIARLQSLKTPFVIVFTKTDLLEPGDDLLNRCRQTLPAPLREAPAVCVSTDTGDGLADVRAAIIAHAPDSALDTPCIIADIVPPGSLVVLVMPVDKEAPKGRLILPQVQTIRDLLDHGCMALCTCDTELQASLDALAEPPALVVTDSQVFGKVAAIVPESVPLTSFSIAFARFKGDLATQVRGALQIGKLDEATSRVLIAEACTHHAIEDDIGRVKIPRMLRKIVGDGLRVDHAQGRDFPDDLAEYDLVIHCGACTLNRQGMLTRLRTCAAAGVPVTNYGTAIAYATGILNRAVAPFPGMADVLAEAPMGQEPGASAPASSR